MNGIYSLKHVARAMNQGGPVDGDDKKPKPTKFKTPAQGDLFKQVPKFLPKIPGVAGKLASGYQLLQPLISSDVPRETFGFQVPEKEDAEERSLLILGCCKTKEKNKGLVSAEELYSGPMYKALQKYREKNDIPENVDIAILSAKHGLIRLDDKIEDYDVTFEKNATLRNEMAAKPEFKATIKKALDNYKDVYVAAGEPYRDVIKKADDNAVRFNQYPQGTQRAQQPNQLKQYLHEKRLGGVGQPVKVRNKAIYGTFDGIDSKTGKAIFSDDEAGARKNRYNLEDLVPFERYAKGGGVETKDIEKLLKPVAKSLPGPLGVGAKILSAAPSFVSAAPSVDVLHGLRVDALKAPSFEDFKKDYTQQIKHGKYYHITEDPNFRIDPEKGASDTMSYSTGQPQKGSLMVTSDLPYWAAGYGDSRKYVAEIDMSDVPRNQYEQVNRGQGNEFFIEDASKAKVKKVVPLDEAIEEADAYSKQIPQSEEELKRFYDATHSHLSLPYNSVPVPASESEMFGALKSNQKEKINAPLPEGQKIGLRLDIDAYTKHDVWVPTLKPLEGKKQLTSHRATAAIKNADLNLSESIQKKAKKVKEGSKKGPFAVIEGEFIDRTDEENYRLAQQYLSDPEWVQVGYNPKKHAYFFDRETDEPVINGEEAIQVGPLVLVKNPVFGRREDFLYAKGGGINSMKHIARNMNGGHGFA